MPVHESPPPSVRIVDPIAPSRPSTPGSERSRRPSLHIPSRVTSQLGLDPKGGNDSGTVDAPLGTAWYAGFSVGKLLDHRWFAWIRPNLKWDLLKPVIRCAVAAWVGWVVQLVQPSQAALGEAAFFVLIVAFIVPPHQAAVQVLESLANMYFFAGLSWAWACLGIFVAHSVRDPVDPRRVSEAEERYAYASDDPAHFQRLITYAGTYIQAKPSIVLAVWLATGCGTLLWYKLRTQPSPATFPIVLACILMDIALTTAVFLPDPFYTAGLLFFLPMAVQGGIAVLATLFIFPRSVSHVFQSKMSGILDPLRQGFTSTEALFADARAQALPADLDDDIDLPSRLEKWAEESRRIRAQLLGSLSGVGPLRALSKYLIVDFSFSRLSGNDLEEVFDQLVLVQIRSAGIGLFYDVISSNARHSHLDSAAFDAHANSRPPSRAASVVELSEIRHDRQQASSSPPSTPSQAPEDHRQFSFFASKRSSSPMRNGRASHLSLLEHLRRAQQPVGVYESQRYMDIERVFSQDTESVIRQLDLMADAALPVIQTCSTALDVAADWLQHANRPKRMSRASGDGLQQAISGLEKSLGDFKQDRLQILLPFRHLFDPNHPPVDLTYKMSYRGLFQNFVAEYHVMEFAHTLLALLVILDRLDTSRIRRQFWYPRPTNVWRHLRGPHQSKDDRDDGEEQTNEDFVGDDELLGEVKKRNPEHTPFDNKWLNALSYLGRVTDVLHSRSFWYAMKAGAITILAALPGFIASSANFYYLHRGVWVLIMAQLTLAAYSGDTTSAFLARLVSSFWGCVFGMIAWYIGSGSGRGNPYGLAAVGAVTFPIAMFFRIHFPGPVLTAVFAPVTFGLVLGYSYLNSTLGSLTEATWGWDVAWRRFLSVSIGITAAWIFAYLPPSFSTRRAIRQTYSRSIIAAGAIFCDILSDANGHHSRMYDNPETKAKLLTWRSKLNAMGTRHQNALHEYSFKGRWPEERYQALQVAVSDLLALMAQLRHVYLQLDRPWRKALLERTRLNDLRFLGDVLAVLSMSSTALRSGTALPQITPSPLVERFRRGKYKGIQLPDSESAEIPALVTVEVLESEAYMRFAVGVTTTFSIMARLDRIVVICKTLLGESYHISGLHYDADATQV